MARMISSALLIAAGVGASILPAHADVTPADVWSGIKAQMSVYGVVTASETNSGGNLSVSDIIMSTQNEEMATSTSLTGSIVFRDLGNGTVAIDFPANMAAKVVAAESGGAPVNVTVNFAQQGMSVIASGAPGNMTHDFSAASMTYSLADFSVDDTPMAGTFDVGLANAAGQWTTSGTATIRQQADYAVDALTIKGLFTDPNTAENVAFDATLNDLDITSDNTIPEGFATLAPDQVFSTGFAVDADMAFGAVTYAVQVMADGQTTQINGTMADGSFGVGMDGDRVRYATVSNGVDVSAAVSGLPVPPVDVHYDTSRFEVLMPIGQSDTAQDFGANVTLKGLTVSDFLWAMFDPAQQLPREPADVVLDLDGKANWLVNIFDPASLEGTPNPGKVESLNLNALEVKIAGAELKGNGGFTFDNEDLQTFGGMPRPTGAIDLALSGGITLLDKLTAMQLVPQEQAMGIKMMSGLFAKPGPSPDTLTTRIEIDPSGGVFANGQRLQ